MAATNPAAFQSFNKIGRWSKPVVISEKIDGSNAQVLVTTELDLIENPDLAALAVAIVNGRALLAGSRNRWLKPEKKLDNFGFAQWVKDNAELLVRLGPGRHFGEWWGAGIQSTYGLDHKRFSLFNVGRFGTGPDKETPPECCHVVPILYEGPNTPRAVVDTLERLEFEGSVAAPGFMKPEGIVIYHTATGTMFKKTLDGDGVPKSLRVAA